MLREDLEITPGASDWTGAPSCLIHDPVSNRFFRLGARAMKILKHWKPVSADRLADRLKAREMETFSPGEVEDIAKFLLANSLAVDKTAQAWRNFHLRTQAGHRALWKKMVHGYLFFRLPLVRPQRFINLCWPIVAPLLSRTFAIVLAILGLASLYLVSQQWEVFKATFVSFLSVEGFAVFAVSLIIIKSLHELGHAFMARKYQVPVPVIGVAFIVLMPILYTETTGAYRLTSRREKLNIDLAGIYTEIALAVLATLAWVFLPDGPLRAIAFSTATLSWIMSVTVNLNPFMRFDGYYVLSDAIGFENLQERGFALAKWRLRELLFGLAKAPPEHLPRPWRRAVILHAWGTWIYRLFLFIAIALLVYNFFFKIAGIAMFAVEIIWFILLPITRELYVWWHERGQISSTGRSKVTLLLLTLLVLVLVIPWSGRVDMPAVARHAMLLPVHSPESGKIVETRIADGMRVKLGDQLVHLVSPTLEEELAKSRSESAIIRQRLSRLTADRHDRSLRLVLEQELAASLNRQSGLIKRIDRLRIGAPRDGVLVNSDRELHAGLWLSPESRLTMLKPDTDREITALVSEADLSAIRVGHIGRFVSDNPEFPLLEVQVERIGVAAVRSLSDPLMGDIHGGRIPVNAAGAKQDNRLTPYGSWYPVHLVPMPRSASSEENAWPVQRGVVILDGERRSLAYRAARRVVGILLRESGF